MSKTNHELQMIAKFKNGKLSTSSQFQPESLEETIKKRLLNARNLNRLDQIDAARMMGYKNSSALSKIETGFAKIPKDFLVKAAITYGVSMDYLMGLHDEPERDPKTAEHQAILRSVREQVNKQNDALVTVLLGNAADMTPMAGHLNSMLAAIEKCFSSFDTVCRKNVEFQEDVLAGSSLQRAIDDAHQVANLAKKFMQHRQSLVETRVKQAAESTSLSLFDRPAYGVTQP